MSQAFLDEVRSKGWKTVPFPIDRGQLFAAADLFLDFCTLEPEDKQRLYKQLYPNDEVSRAGYFQRAKAAGNYDDKHIWHHHTSVHEHFGDDPLWSHAKVKAFVAAADAILAASIQTFSAVLDEFEVVYPGLKEKYLPNGTAPKVYLRFIKYIPQKPGEFLAKGHFDRGCATLAICESAPGLRLGRDPQTLEPLVHQDRTAVFFPDLLFHEATDKTFQPIWHDVIQKTEDQYREDCARWAIVLFADTFDMVPPTVAEARKYLM